MPAPEVGPDFSETREAQEMDTGDRGVGVAAGVLWFVAMLLVGWVVLRLAGR
jgi:hypothetical protein